MFDWLRRIKLNNGRAETLLEEAHASNVEAVKTAKLRAKNTSKQADKALKQVYDINQDVAKRVFIATGQK